MIAWFFIIVFLSAGVITAYASWKWAPYAPTPMLAVESALDLAELKEGEVIMDLGAGDGRVVVLASRRGAKAIGYELSPFVWLAANINLLIHRSHGRVKMANGFNVDLSKADVIFLFLMPKAMDNLSKELLAKIRPGTRIVTYVFGFPDLKAEKEIKPKNCASIRLYVKR